jgi:hypothetical protein
MILSPDFHVILPTIKTVINNFCEIMKGKNVNEINENFIIFTNTSYFLLCTINSLTSLTVLNEINLEYGFADENSNIKSMDKFSKLNNPNFNNFSNCMLLIDNGFVPLLIDLLYYSFYLFVICIKII